MTGRGDRGSVAVEFALLLPVLLLIVFGLIDFGRATWYQITLTQAAREGARVASLGWPATGTNSVTSRVQSMTTPNGITPVTVTITPSTSPPCTTGAGAGVDAVVTVSYSYSFLTPVAAIATLAGGRVTLPSSLNLTATADMPCETLSAAAATQRCCCSAATTAGWSPSWSGC